MSGIWNLSSICRFCHNDGIFRKFTLPSEHCGQNESYGDLLQKTFNISMSLPVGVNASNMICEECISSLTEAAKFKDQVQACENKFQQYVQNELFAQENYVKDSLLTDVKVEFNDEKTDVKVECEFDETLPVKIEKSSICEDEDVKFGEDNNYELYSPDNNTIEIDFTPEDKVDVIKEGEKSLMITKSIKKNIGKKDNKKTVTGNVTCYVCFKSLPKIELPKHLKEIHTGPYKCKYCEQKFHKYDTLSFHIRNKHKQNWIKKYTCNFCQKTCKTEKSLFFHLEAHFRQKVYECDICHRRLASRTVILKHLRTHDPERLDKVHECPQCSWRFANNTNLINHIKVVHQRIRNYSCTRCIKTFATKKNLDIHFRVHTDERPYECEICHKRYRIMYTLNKHKSKQHNIGRKIENVYKCKSCNVKFDHKGLYMDHLKTHTESSFVCDECGLIVTCNKSLLRHRLTHAKPRFACDTCGIKYKFKLQLERHVRRIHLNIVVKSKCEKCGKLVVDLKQHLLTHDSRRFGCTVCDKTFSKRNILTRHLRDIHSGYKLYVCEICDKRYTTKNALARHNLKCRN